MKCINPKLAKQIKEALTEKQLSFEDVQKNNVLSDMVAEDMGVTIKPEEARIITEKANKISEHANTIKGDFSYRPEAKDDLVKFFEAKRDMDKYIQSLNPTNQAKVAFSTIGRGNMLLAVKSTLVNIISNTVRGGTAFLERRALQKGISGANNGFAVEYMKYANKVYDKSGYDVTRMMSMEQDSFARQGEKISHSQGKGVIRKIGRFYEDLVYTKMLGKPDVVASSFSFADSANLTSTSLAKKEGLKGTELVARAREIFQDATNPSPVTKEGQLVRNQAIKDATYDTYTNDSFASKLALKVRDTINHATGNVGAGEFVMPFVKTPANVVEAGLDASGLGAVKALYQLPKALKELRAGNPLALRPVIQNAVKTGVGITGAYLLSTYLKPTDYMGEYPTSAKEKQLLDLKQATTNSIRVGNKWISLDYFGPLAAPLTGIMYSKKYGKDGAPLDKIIQYLHGTSTQILHTPGLQESYDITSSIITKVKNPKIDMSQEINDYYNSAVDGVTSRLLPAIVSDLSKASDKFQRKTDYTKPLTKAEEKIPGLRLDLPQKKTIFGVPKLNESPVSQILFGARVKTATNDPVVTELSRLEKTGNLPSITNVETSNPRVKKFKTQVDSKRYNEFINKYQTELYKAFQGQTKSPDYFMMKDEDKAKALDNLKTQILNTALDDYGYQNKK